MIILSAEIFLKLYFYEKICFTSCLQYVKDRFVKSSRELPLYGRFNRSENVDKKQGDPCLCRCRELSSLFLRVNHSLIERVASLMRCFTLQKGGVPAAPSGTATLLRLSPNYQFCPRTLLAVTYFRHPRLSWLDGRCVQGPGTYSPRHG